MLTSVASSETGTVVLLFFLDLSECISSKHFGYKVSKIFAYDCNC